MQGIDYCKSVSVKFDPTLNMTEKESLRQPNEKNISKEQKIENNKNKFRDLQNSLVDELRFNEVRH